MSEQFNIETILQLVCVAYQKGADHCFHCNPNPENPYTDKPLQEAYECGLEHARKEKRPCIIEDTQYFLNLPMKMKRHEPLPENYLIGLDGHKEPCYYCDELTNSLAADPGSWPLAFTHPDGTGEVKWHHTRCVQERLFKDEINAPKTV